MKITLAEQINAVVFNMNELSHQVGYTEGEGRAPTNRQLLTMQQYDRELAGLLEQIPKA